MALTASQRRKAREALARKRGVPTSSISDADVTTAIANSVITSSDTGSSCYGGGDGGGFSGGDAGASCI
jgi:hypothetical protein